MVEINSDDYHDYVFKKGKLIGEFEQMYQKSKDIPWHQDKKDADRLDYKIALSIASTVSPFDEICDIGCGLGYFLDALKILGTDDCKLTGFDISQTATKRAKEIFPDFIFKVIDVTESHKTFKTKVSSEQNITKQRKLTAIRGFFWYVFPHMDNVIRNISHLVDKEQYLLISQNFPPLDDEFIGKNVIPNPDKLLNLFAPNFMPVVTNWLEDKQSNDNDNWFTTLMMRI
jgi:SAM-dependent methyltransferase